MTFTYTISTTPTDLAKIRYYTGDTDSTAPIWTDEEIAMVQSMEGSVGATIISLIESIQRKLANEPDMQADWLRVDWRRSVDEWNKLLARAEQKFGEGWHVVSGGQHSYRPDSLQKEAPDYGEE